MKYFKRAVEVKVLTGKEPEAIREQNFSDEIMAEVQAFRAGK